MKRDKVADQRDFREEGISYIIGKYLKCELEQTKKYGNWAFKYLTKQRKTPQTI